MENEKKPPFGSALIAKFGWVHTMVTDFHNPAMFPTCALITRKMIVDSWGLTLFRVSLDSSMNSEQSTARLSLAHIPASNTGGVHKRQPQHAYSSSQYHPFIYTALKCPDPRTQIESAKRQSRNVSIHLHIVRTTTLLDEISTAFVWLRQLVRTFFQCVNRCSNF